MKLSRRQFMKKVVAAGVVVPPLALSNLVSGERKWFNESCQGRGKKLNVGVPQWDDCDIFDPSGCCFWEMEKILRCKFKFSVFSEIILRRIKVRIPPKYRNKIIVYLDCYIPSGCYTDFNYKEPFKFAIMYITEHNREECQFKIECLLKLGWHRYTSDLGDHVIFHNIPGRPVVFDDKKYGVIKVDSCIE